MQKNAKRKVLIGFAISAAALLMAGTAYACTVYKGRVTLTAAGSSNTATAVGKGGMPHEYCSGEERQTVDMNARNEFTVKVEAATIAKGDCEASALPAGKYEVRWVNMFGSDLPKVPGVNDKYNYNCNVAASNVFMPGVITVDKYGSGSGTFTQLKGGPGPFFHTPSDGASGAVNLCVAPAANNPTSDSAPELALWVI